ncbi:NB-ARC domain-containing protein [Nonomuraea sp. SYSU D8015]|uniref:NB-ARC domain-containing protein n=1 Tax=Nonomuraea sp. SYSU D8015 TaxID=2593644 RepID=UPI00166159C9|nr:NB-ARC domain-containing protein [Nonomuraea sp. SYSU D8015]
MARPKNRLPGLLLVLVSLLGVLVGLPVNVVSTYLPAAVVSYKVVWVAGLALLALAISSLTWIVPWLQERRRAGALFSVPAMESWVDRPELAATIRALMGDQGRLSSLAGSIKEERERVFQPLDARIVLDKWANVHHPAGSTKNVFVVGIFGHGGSGKTSLAAAVCFRPDVRRFFKGGILWMTLGRDKQDRDLVERLNDAVGVMTGERPATSDPEQASQYLRQALSERKRTLLVVDDVWDDRALELLVPNEPSYSLLFTTRMRTLLSVSTRAVDVDRLYDDTASRILGSGLPALPRRAEVELLDATGRLPLLLSLVNRRLREDLARGSDISLAADQAIGHLRERGPVAFDARSRSRREKLVADTMEYSVETLGPDERQRFLELSIFPEDTAIPTSVVEFLWARTGRLAAKETAQLCERLEELSLVSRRWSDGLQLVQLHSIIRRYARMTLTEQGIARCNELLLEAIQVSSHEASRNRRWWRSPIGSDYFMDNLVYHFKEARLADRLERLVSDFEWLRDRITRSGVFAAEKDLAEMRTPLAEKLGSAILQNAHLFNTADTGDIVAGTLLTRLHDIPEFSKSIHDHLARSSAWRLRPQWPFADEAPNSWLSTRGHRSAVAAIAVAPEGSWFVSAGLDGVLNKYSVGGLEQTTLIRHSAGMTSVAIAPSGDWVVAGDDKGAIHMMSADGTGLLSLKAHQGRVNSVAVSHDGSWLASAGNDGTILLWEIDGSRRGRLHARSGEVQSLAIPARGPWLVSADSDGAVRLWDQNGGISRVLFGRSRRLSDLAVSPDGGWLAAAGDSGIIQLWQADGRERAILRGHRGTVRSVAISPDGEWIASGGLDGSLRLWTADATKKRVAQYNCGGVSTVAIAPHGMWLASGGLDGSLRVWISGTLWQAGSASRGVDIRSVAVSPDGTWLASACSDGSVRLWDANGTPREILNQHDRWVNQVSIAADGSWLASAGWDGKVCIWGSDGSQGGALIGHPGGATAVAIAPDGSWLAAAAWNGSVHVWDMAYREPREVLSGSRLWVNCIAIAPDGTWWVTAAEDGRLLTWNADGTPRGILHGHKSGVRSVAIAPNGSWLASADMSGEVRLWDAKGILKCVLKRDDSAIASVAISFDGALLATTYSDGLMRLWDPKRAISLTAARLPGPLRSCAWFPDADSLCVSGAKGLYRFAAEGPNSA